MTKLRIAIIGGGPSALMICKNLINTKKHNLDVQIFERNDILGAGLPYGEKGANLEHVTNVSANEIPELVSSFKTWLRDLPTELLAPFQITESNFNEFKVLPRLLFGMYLSSQFQLILKQGNASTNKFTTHKNTNVEDIIYDKKYENYIVQTTNGDRTIFDKIVICIGHVWPPIHEGKVPNYFDSPYPPAKLAQKFNHPICIRGSSLTAIDAVRTLARNNGSFSTDRDGKLSYQLFDDTPAFRLVMYSIKGLLPAIRFHVDNSRVSADDLLSNEQINQNRLENGGFLSLDYVFENAFKTELSKRDPHFYNEIKDLTIEEFVSDIMGYRESRDPFELFREEYLEADRSIHAHKAIVWKELLSRLSYIMNYPAKYFSAEDTIRLQKVLAPLISVVIAFVPQSSANEFIALHEAGVLDVIAVTSESSVKPIHSGGAEFQFDKSGKDKVSYDTYIDCTGQRHLNIDEFPFKGLVRANCLSSAYVNFRSDEAGEIESKRNKNVGKRNEQYVLNLPGITINDSFQCVDTLGLTCNDIYVMAVPYIGGYNPDYSGLDFCETASGLIVSSLLGDS